MTDDHRGHEDESELSRPPGMPEEEHDDAAALEGAGDFTSGEGLVVFAGIVLLLVWVIFDFIADAYPMDNLVPVLGALALILPRLDRDTVEKVLPLPVLMKITGWAIFLIGVVELLGDFRAGIFDDFGAIIGALAAYAGYGMAFIGTRQIEI
jgi:hypothetical protein